LKKKIQRYQALETDLADASGNLADLVVAVASQTVGARQ
jgi:hypothetical protein